MQDDSSISLHLGCHGDGGNDEGCTPSCSQDISMQLKHQETLVEDII